jgi:hypothetical protein
MFKSFFARRRLRKTFELYLSPDLARQVADGTLPTTGTEQFSRITDFAFVAVSAPDAPTYSERAGIVANVANQHGGVIPSLIPVVVVTFGSIQPASPGSRLRFVSGVQARLPDSAAIVHGTIAASVGSFGSESFFLFGFWWPGSLSALRLLTTLAPGEVREIANEQNA